MKDIKTRDHNKTIRTLDKAAIAHDRMKDVAIRAKENAVPATQDDAENTTDYGVQEARNVSGDTVYTARRAASSTLQKSHRNDSSEKAPKRPAAGDTAKNAPAHSRTEQGAVRQPASSVRQKDLRKSEGANISTERGREKVKSTIKERRTGAAPKTRGAAANRPTGKTARIRTPGSSAVTETAKGAAGKQHAIASAQTTAAARAWM